MIDFMSEWDDDSDDDHSDLPLPDVEVMTNDNAESRTFTEAGVKGMAMNPVYAGIGPFPAIVDDDKWIRVCKKVMEEDTPEQFLVNLLFLLRKSLGQVDED